MGSLKEYRRKRDARRTPEPVPADGPLPTGADDTFVIQEHHASQLHWDFRLERDGVLVSWAVPKGLPLDPATNHLAVHTEDHPLEYASFAGEIPAGEYGGGQVTIWDRGTYETEKWSSREVKVVLHGSRISGRYVLFRTDGKNWMVHRMEPPPDPDWRPIPDDLRPMSPWGSRVPAGEDGWGYQFWWDGERALAAVEGGRVRLIGPDGEDLTGRYPELRALGLAMGSDTAVLDGELVVMGPDRKPEPEWLAERREAAPTKVRRLSRDRPAIFLISDLLYLAGRLTLEVPFGERAALLADALPTGAGWQVVEPFDDGPAVLAAAAAEVGAPAVLAKQSDSDYRPGKRSRSWRRLSVG
jgi:bifunctional non-homologous end joining protein LigD